MAYYANYILHIHTYVVKYWFCFTIIACHGPTLSRGLLWPLTAVNDTAMLQCSDINPSTFRAGPYATRKCLNYSDVNVGLWDEADITNCTTRSDQPLVTYSTYLLTEINEDITQNITEIELEVLYMIMTLYIPSW